MVLLGTQTQRVALLLIGHASYCDAWKHRFDRVPEKKTSRLKGMHPLMPVKTTILT